MSGTEIASEFDVNDRSHQILITTIGAHFAILCRELHQETACVVESVSFQTDRLLLRPFMVRDVEDSLSYRDDEEFARFLPHIPQPFTLADAENFVATNMHEPWDQYPTFAVVIDGKVIGTVNLEIDLEERSAMLGYAIGRAHWGQGIAVEAAHSVLAWAFDDLDLMKVFASTDVSHLRSRRVLEKLGMREEGVVPGHHINRDGQSVDEVTYLLLRQEWAE